MTELVDDGIIYRSTKGVCSLDGCYNRMRRHSILEIMSPVEFEKQLKNLKGGVRVFSVDSLEH